MIGIAGILAGIVCVFFSRAYIHILQLEDYKITNYRHWIIKNLNNLYKFMFSYDISKLKKPLIYTKRVRRFIISLFIIGLIEYLIFTYPISINKMQYFPSIVLLLTAAFFLFYLIPFNILVTSIIIYPIEETIKNHYFKNGEKKIKSFSNLTVIGITGSYGKTSTKFILAQILSEKYKVLATPSSFNTPMGLTKVIREKLDETYNIFISEMGARQKGDIELLCKLVKPKIGIITSIGKQHLETFKTVDNIVETKYELIESLPSDGLGVFCGDNQYCIDMYNKTNIDKILYGINKEDKSDLYVWASDIHVSSKGSSFLLKDNQ
jgi:UDP-N-acetylmuramoyl-tripeptide--D-alanyl-D-alanine ligase